MDYGPETVANDYNQSLDYLEDELERIGPDPTLTPREKRQKRYNIQMRIVDLEAQLNAYVDNLEAQGFRAQGIKRVYRKKKPIKKVIKKKPIKRKYIKKK